GYKRASEAVLKTIAPKFKGKTYKSKVSDNCCVWTSNTYENWGMPATSWNAVGTFQSGPVLGGSLCTQAQQHFPSQLTLLKSNNQTTLYQSLVLWAILFGCLFLVAGPLALKLSYALPSVEPRTIPSHFFSEQRARDYYSNLTQYGPRVINTRVDYLTRDFLISQIHRIHSTATSAVQFDLSLQNFTTHDIDQLQNIAVRISNPSSQPDTPCLMLAAHYDSGTFK
ncbi:unnamed protein product, partial [Rotaria sp. Silwood1]